MAESATETRKGRRTAARDAEDSVDAEFGGDYSEGSLELLRQLGSKGAQFGQVEAWEEQAIQPPAQEECDAALKELEALDHVLGQVKQYKPDAKELAWIDYKRALVEDASDGEVAWLKLKAYHHGLDMLRAASGGITTPQPGGDVPHRDTVAEASALPSDFAASRQAVLQAVRSLLPSSSSSGEEEGIAEVAASALPRLASHAQASSSNRHAAAAAATGVAPTIAASAAAVTTGTVYNPDYLEELHLTRLLSQQRQQRSSAFLLGLAAAAGLSVARWWLRRRRGRNGRRAGQPLPPQ